MLRHLFVAAHRVGDARAGVDTGQSRTDQGEKHGDRFDHHEGLAMAA